MSIYSNKEVLKYALREFETYTSMWDEKYQVYAVADDRDIPQLWSILLVKSAQKFIVVKNIDAENNNGLKAVLRADFIKELQDFEDINYKLYYKHEDQHLVGYLLDFFNYYVEMPDKIMYIK